MCVASTNKIMWYLGCAPPWTRSRLSSLCHITVTLCDLVAPVVLILYTSMRKAKMSGYMKEIIKHLKFGDGLD